MSVQSDNLDGLLGLSSSAVKQVVGSGRRASQFEEGNKAGKISANAHPLTKIICTIGPGTKSVESLSGLMERGMNVARLNFSHGDHDYHRGVIKNIRECCARSRRICAILLDTKGPEIRTILLKDGKDVLLKKNSSFLLTTDASVVGDADGVAVTYKNLPQVVQAGNRVLLDDGLIELEVERTTATTVVCKVLNAGTLGQNKGVNLPGVVVDLPAVTEKDINDITFGVKQGVDFIAASFVRKAADVLEIKRVLGDEGKSIKIISKIESQEGLDHFDAILAVSDGIMVARGDLGVEIPIEQVSIAQKMMIRKCNQAGKPVVTATQMLESMVSNPSPTRAEASDVANAVIDGTDCVMLSGETAKGKYPLEAVQMMADICWEAESTLHHLAQHFTIKEMSMSAAPISVSEAIASCAVKASFDMKATSVICLTETGKTSRLISKYRPAHPIIAVTPSEQCARQSMVNRGVFPFLVSSTVGADSVAVVAHVMTEAKKMGMCAAGDTVVLCAGTLGESGSTNDLKIIVVPEN